MKNSVLLIIANVAWRANGVFGTIDINLSEFEYLASHLDPFECRRLVAALHFKTYELPMNIAGAVRKIDEDIPCLQLLLHWNSSPAEGIGKTHDAVEHRLRQLNHHHLAKWLGKTVFTKLGGDIEKSLVKPFGELGEQDAETQYPITLEPIDVANEENPWTQIDTILMAIMLLLGGCLLFMVLSLILHKLRSSSRRNRRKPLSEDEERLLNSDTE